MPDDTGAPFNLPFPVAGDPDNVPNDVEALAQGVADALTALLAGTSFTFDGLTIGHSGGAVLNLYDPGAAANRRRARLRTVGGSTLLEVLDDTLSIVVPVLSVSHVTGRVDATGEAWHEVGSGGSEPAFDSHWSNDGSFPSLRFHRHLGRVYLEGIARRDTTGGVITTLPAGYRPDRAVVLEAQDQGTVTKKRVEVATNGVVTIFSAVNATWYEFNDQSFRVA